MSKSICLVTAIVVSLITAILLSFETFLAFQGKSLCSTAACAIVNRYLSIDETILITFGASFFWIVSILFFFAQRYPQQIGFLPYCVLFLALAVDGNLIGFQFFTIQQRCILCISVAAVLLAISIFYCLSRKAYLLLSCCLLAWLGAFATHSIMKIPPPTSAGKQMIFFQKASGPEPQRNESTFTLIFSMECPHCVEVISTLAKYDVQNITWQLASIDNDQVSLMKLSKFRQQAAMVPNFFKLLEEIKNEPLENHSISNAVKQCAENTKYFLANLDITEIPVLIVDGSKANKEIYVGTPSILHAITQLLE